MGFKNAICEIETFSVLCWNCLHYIPALETKQKLHWEKCDITVMDFDCPKCNATNKLSMALLNSLTPGKKRQILEAEK